MEDPQPLKGLLVVALEQAVAAPLCTQRLADAGARVIKIEREGGETARHYDRAVKGTSAYFAWLNRGKESTIFDLKKEDDLAVVKAMVAQADVFVSNLAPGAVERLGLGHADMEVGNPRLISLKISGYGSQTDFAMARAYDALVQAESGVCSVTGTAEEPVKVGVSVADIATGMNAHAAILEALIERSITGRGRALEMTLFDSLADWMNVPLMHYEYLGRTVDRVGLAHSSIYPYGAFSCSDGAIMVVTQNASEWSRLCRFVLERPDLETDPRFHDNPARDANRKVLDAEMRPIFAAMTCAEAIAKLEANTLPSGRINTVEGLSAHPALRRRQAEAAGQVYQFVAPPLHIHGGRNRVPAAGEHTQAVRREFGGRS